MAILQEESSGLRFPTAIEFLSHIRNRQLVTFRKLEDPKVRHLSLP